MADYSKLEVIDLSKVEISAEQITKSKKIEGAFKACGHLMAFPYTVMAVAFLMTFILPKEAISHDILASASKPVSYLAPSIWRYSTDLLENSRLDLNFILLASFYGSLLSSIFSLKYLHCAFLLADANYLIYSMKKKGRKKLDLYGIGLAGLILPPLCIVIFVLVLTSVDFSHKNLPRIVGGSPLPLIPLIFPSLFFMMFITLSSAKLLIADPAKKHST